MELGSLLEKTKKIKLKQMIVLFVSLSYFTAQAACTNPSGVAGQIQWVVADGKVEFCDGNSWKDTSVSTNGSCAGTSAGTINYSSGDLRYCNSTNWISMKGSTVDTCPGTTAGNYNYNSINYRYCDGTNLYQMKPLASLTVDNSTVARVSGNVLLNTDLTTASFTPPNNSLLLVMVNAFTWNNATVDIDVSVSDTGSHAWSEIIARDPKSVQLSGYQGHASAWYAQVNIANAMTISVRRTGASDTNADYLSFKVYIITGHDRINPIGAIGSGSEQSLNNSSPTAYVSEFNNSWGFATATDANALGLPSSTDVADAGDTPGGLSYISLMKSSATATAGSAVTFNLDAAGTGTPKWNWVAVEVVPEQPASSSPILVRRSMVMRVVGAPSANVNLTSPSFTPPNNSLLVLMLTSDTASGVTPSFQVSDSGGNTWTMAVKADYGLTSKSGHASAWYAKINTGSAMTVSVKHTDATNLFSFKVYVITGHNTTTPIGATNYGGDSATNNLTLNAYTSTANNSLGMGCATDWNALGVPDSTDIKDAATFPGAVSVISVTKAFATPTSGSTVTLNFDAFGTSAPGWNWVAIEVKPAP